MRTASYDLNSKTARLKLKARKKPYCTNVRPRLLLGYVRQDAGAGAGRWVLVAERSVALASGKLARRRHQVGIGIADDYQHADDATVLSFAQALARASHADELFDGVKAARVGLTVAQAIQHYVESIRSERGERYAKDAEGRLAKHVLPVLGSTPVASLTLSALQQWKNALIPGDATDAERRARRATVNRILANFKAALNLAFRDESHAIPSDKAWRALAAHRQVGGAREHHFSETETALLIDAARKLDPAFGDLVEAGAWSGARYGELAACDVRHLDAKHHMLKIPRGKTGARSVALSTAALVFFRRLTQERPRSAPLLARGDGGRWGASHQHRPMKAALKAAKLDTRASFYVLRHSYISRAVENGLPVTIIAENVGTSVRMIEQTYQHLFARKRQEWVERAAPVFSVIQGGKRDAA